MSDEVRILIVDDDRIIRVAVKRILEKSGYKFVVEEAPDVLVLFDILKTKKISCLILDYFLSATTGLDIIEKLKKEKVDIPVIMLTGQGDELIAVKVLKAGAYDYLPKSILSHADAPEILGYTIHNAINIFKEKLEKERTAIALQKSEERYRNLVENSPMLIFRFFPDDKSISFVNDGFCEYFNTTRSDMIGDNIYRFLFADRQEEIDAKINLMNMESPVTNFNYYTETKKGIRWQLWTVQGLFDKKGNVLEYQCIGEDITPLKEAEKELYSQKVYFQSILDSQENMIIVTDKSQIIEANHSFLIFFGYRNLDDFKIEHSDIIELALNIPGYISKKEGMHWIDLILNDTYAQRLMAFRPEGKQTKIFSVNINLLSLEREVFVVTFSDVTELEQKSKSFEEKASLDALTGIYNKDKFNELLSYNVSASKRYGLNLSLIFFDIDHFKKINDSFGHQEGDAVLQELVEIIKSCIRKSDIFARWGGEEFTVLLPQISLENALRVAEKFRKKVANSGFKVIKSLTCSFGVTKFNERDTIETFVNRADKALYRAKESGRNRVVGIKGERAAE